MFPWLQWLWVRTFTLGLTAVLWIIGGTIVGIIGLLKAWLNKDMYKGLGIWIIGGLFVLVGSPIINNNDAARRIKVAEEAERFVYITKHQESMPEAWKLVAGFLRDEQSHGATHELIIHRFVTEGYGDEPAPRITLDQHRVFVDELTCNGLASVNWSGKCG